MIKNELGIPLISIVSPEKFSPRWHAAGCLCEQKNTFLLVKRHPDKPYGNTWALPGGKLEMSETPREGVIREVYEEIGIDIDHHTLQEAGTFYVRHLDIDYVFHVFRMQFVQKPSLILNFGEHVEARWLTLKEAKNLPLIVGAEEMFRLLKLE